MRITLKCATSLDGRIALANGDSRWITGPDARKQGQHLRAAHDAVLVGSGTVMADDPLLTVRDLDIERQPVRVVADGRLRLRPDHKLAQSTDQGPVWVLSLAQTRPELHDLGLEVITLPDMTPDQQIQAFQDKGITSLMIEGGGTLAASYLKAGLITHIEWFRAPIILGGDGRPAFGDLSLSSLSEAQVWCRTAMTSLGEDLWERYERLEEGDECLPA